MATCTCLEKIGDNGCEVHILKTRAELEALKSNWHADPIWDIEETEGFAAYHAELLAYRLECEAKWQQQALTELRTFAASIGLDNNLKLAEHLRWIESRLSLLETKVFSLNE